MTTDFKVGARRAAFATPGSSPRGRRRSSSTSSGGTRSAPGSACAPSSPWPAFWRAASALRGPPTAERPRTRQPSPARPAPARRAVVFPGPETPPPEGTSVRPLLSRRWGITPPALVFLGWKRVGFVDGCSARVAEVWVTSDTTARNARAARGA